MITQVADYEIIEPLGTGDNEETYVAVPPARLGLAAAKVAIKVVHGLGNDRVIQRATDELRIFATVDSPYLIRLYDAGQDDDALFYVMDFPSHGTLEQPSGPLPLAERLRAVAHAARGAHALHQAGVVHRTITPSRVHIDGSGGKLADLGLARFVSPGIVMSTMPDVSQIEYLDPALLRGSPASRASDIWSLGAVLHFAASDGQHLYPGLPTGNPLGAVRRVLTGPCQVADSVPADIATLVRSAVAPNPSDRPATAEELADRTEALGEAA